MTLYSVAGLTTQIDLPVPLIIDLLPYSQEKRPGIARQTPGAWVQHETANYNYGADAAMHDRWLHNLTGTYLSFHFCVDDKQIYQFVPVNEITYQAADGAGPGNMAGVSCELCVNRDADWSVARRNAEALAGGVCKALGITAITRHYDYNAGDPDRHYCPKEMMTSGYWPTFVANVGRIIGGPTPMPDDSIFPPGVDLDLAKEWFGEVVQDRVPYRFAIGGAVSTVWLNYGKATGLWPKLIDRKVYDTRTYFFFDNGLVIWSPGNAGYSVLRS